MSLLGCISHASMLDVDGADGFIFFYGDMKAMYVCTAKSKRDEKEPDVTLNMTCCDIRGMRPAVDIHLQRASRTPKINIPPRSRQ